MLTHKQSGVLRGMLTGLAMTIVALALAMNGVLTPLMPGAESALGFALKWDMLVLACLAVSIGMLARHRFFTPDDIDGGGLTEGTAKAHLLQSMLQNTLEQTVLALGVHLTWATAMPRAFQAAVPVAAILFVIGRVLFWRGYAAGAPRRALGFALTFYPQVAMLLVIAGWLVAR
ncbi:MAPEG family protein [Pseudorhodoplanes sp.]|uniref:MAPEG family protein n=1 Tax=Pseudorhodoplanes sp. TaxID=1934341 RepID=UPI00391920BD